MKRFLLFFSLSFLCLLHVTRSFAQDFEHAGQYMDHINKANGELSIKYLVYLSAVSHGKSARKVEKRRAEVVNAINDTRYLVQTMPPWKGDRSLKDTTVAYLKILYSVFNEDYGKIVNMEEIAEQSYDAMEAYLLAQEKAHEKLDDASDRQHNVQTQFAKKNDIKLIEGNSEIEQKSKIVNAVMKHANEVYLVFFKSHKQQGYLIEAVERKNIVSIEQNLNSLEKFSDEGIKKLGDMKGYLNDGSLIASCRRMLSHYKEEVKKGTAITDFILKTEEFVKMKKQFESKPSGKRTQQDVDQFNKGVNDINAASKVFNEQMADQNKKSNAALNDWNKTYSKYLDEHMPKQSKK